MDIIPSGQALGARVNGIDLAQPLSDGDFRSILRALGGYGVLCFPQQTLDSDQFAAFGRRFGELEINVANAHHEPSSSRDDDPVQHEKGREADRCQ